MTERTLTDKDIDALATTLIEKVHAHKHDFWIDPEKHYQEHALLRGFKPDEISSLHDLVAAYRSARGLFWKAFLGFAIIGALIATAVGMGFHK